MLSTTSGAVRLRHAVKIAAVAVLALSLLIAHAKRVLLALRSGATCPAFTLTSGTFGKGVLSM